MDVDAPTGSEISWGLKAESFIRKLTCKRGLIRGTVIRFQLVTPSYSSQRIARASARLAQGSVRSRELCAPPGPAGGCSARTSHRRFHADGQQQRSRPGSKGEPHTTALHVYVEDRDPVLSKIARCWRGLDGTPQDHEYRERGGKDWPATSGTSPRTRSSSLRRAAHCERLHASAASQSPADRFSEARVRCRGNR